MSQYQAVIFDLDGTLLNTLDDLADSLNRVLASSGFPQHGLDAYRYFVGDGVENLVRRALPENARDKATLARCVAGMRTEYGAHWADKTRPYDGIPGLLDNLLARGLRMAVLSNKPDNFTQLTVSSLLSKWRFELVLGERPGVPRKPDPGGALEIARAFGLAPAQFLYLGDTRTDMLTANAAGMFAVGVLWGFRPEEELKSSGAKALIGRPEELLNYL
jgi:phosphoglycolate phosphatase